MLRRIHHGLNVGGVISSDAPEKSVTTWPRCRQPEPPPANWCRRLRHSPLLADVVKQPGPGIRPLPVQSAIRMSQCFGDFRVAQPAEELKHNNTLRLGIFKLKAFCGPWQGSRGSWSDRRSSLLESLPQSVCDSQFDWDCMWQRLRRETRCRTRHVGSAGSKRA